MQSEFNQLPESTNDQLERLISNLRAFVNENATALSFDNYATIAEISKQGELFQQCIERNDWKPVVVEFLKEGDALLRFLQKDLATPSAEFNG